MEEPNGFYFVVLQQCGTQWVNVWHKDGKPMIFASEDDAEQELAEHFEMYADAFVSGQCEDVPHPDEFMIVQVRGETDRLEYDEDEQHLFLVTFGSTYFYDGDNPIIYGSRRDADEAIIYECYVFGDDPDQYTVKRFVGQYMGMGGEV